MEFDKCKAISDKAIIDRLARHAVKYKTKMSKERNKSGIGNTNNDDPRIHLIEAYLELDNAYTDAKAAQKICLLKGKEKKKDRDNDSPSNCGPSVASGCRRQSP